jgi:hypothetical protein
MNKLMITAALAVGLMLGYSSRAVTEADSKLPVASANAAKDFAGAKEMPDPGVDYKGGVLGGGQRQTGRGPPDAPIGLYLNTSPTTCPPTTPHRRGVPSGRRRRRAGQ